MAEKPNILIAVPAYGGPIKNGCVSSVVNLTRALATNNVQFEFLTVDSGDIAEVRNFLGSYLLEEKRYSHIALIDYDMTFSPRGIFEMLKANKPLIGWVAPRKQRPLAINAIP